MFSHIHLLTRVKPVRQDPVFREVVPLKVHRLVLTKYNYVIIEDGTKISVKLNTLEYHSSPSPPSPPLTKWATSLHNSPLRNQHCGTAGRSYTYSRRVVKDQLY